MAKRRNKGEERSIAARRVESLLRLAEADAAMWPIGTGAPGGERLPSAGAPSGQKLASGTGLPTGTELPTGTAARDAAATLARRHVALARRVATRYQLPLQPAQKQRFCRACGLPRTLAPVRVRIHRHRLITTCRGCGHIARRPLGGA